eukprot:scaffold48155_cov67-Phaeocystis_antarctica.AAC.2
MRPQPPAPRSTLCGHRPRHGASCSSYPLPPWRLASPKPVSCPGPPRPPPVRPPPAGPTPSEHSSRHLR